MKLKLDQAPFSIPVSEGPEDVKAYWIETDDRLRLRVAHWLPKGSSKGTVFLFQGRTENIEKYGKVAAELYEGGYECLCIDFRGQGLSHRFTDDRMLGHVEEFSDYQLDVKAMTKLATDLKLPKPWFLIAHSLGAGIGLRALSEGFDVNGAVFCAPLWGINLKPLQRLAAWPLGAILTTIGKKHAYVPSTAGTSYVLTTPFEENRLTNDPRMYRYYQSVSENLVEHQTGGPSIGWFYEALKEMNALAKEKIPTTPCYTICGADDTIVDIKAVKKKMSGWTNGSLEIFENSKHDVLHEVPRIHADVFTKIRQYFEEWR